MMICKVLESETFDYIIVSGNFGIVFNDFCSNHFGKDFSDNIIDVNGGIRKGNEVEIFYKKYDINNKNLVLLMIVIS